MSTHAQVTEAHVLATRTIQVAFSCLPYAEAMEKVAQLIADSEAKACELALAKSFTENPVMMTLKERDQLRDEVERLKPYVSKAVLTHEGTMLCSPLVAVEFNEQTARAELAEASLHALRLICGTTDADKFSTWVDRANARAEEAEHDCRVLISRLNVAEAELANIRALANRRNKRDHVEDTTHQLVAALDQALDIAQAELATERARIADLVADLNDACITLTSAEEDCDDYAMRNTRFKLTAVREVLLQHILNAAMKEETK